MRRLLIFLKCPTPGEVKTRLAASISDEAAAGLYRACAELTLRRLDAFRRDATLCIDPPDALADVEQWLGHGWAVRPQQGVTLGDRLAEATSGAILDGAKHVVVIGTDSPWIDAPAIDAAFAALEQSDVVLGPTEDGGYYLVGLSRQMRCMSPCVS